MFAFGSDLIGWKIGPQSYKNRLRLRAPSVATFVSFAFCGPTLDLIDLSLKDLLYNVQRAIYWCPLNSPNYDTKRVKRIFHRRHLLGGTRNLPNSNRIARFKRIFIRSKAGKIKVETRQPPFCPDTNCARNARKIIWMATNCDNFSEKGRKKERKCVFLFNGLERPPRAILIHFR